jgi:hypothetical protein
VKYSCRQLLLTAPAALRLRAVPLTNNSELMSPYDRATYVNPSHVAAVTSGHYRSIPIVAEELNAGVVRQIGSERAGATVIIVNTIG